MARIDNLTNFLTDVASAIKTKKGDNTPIQASNFDTEITNLPSGSTEPEEKDVNFYDYDGTRLYSYTKAEFLQLESLPSNPTHSGLTSQGWNWSLLNSQTYVNAYGMLDIGQMYVTDDGKTRIYISSKDALSVKVQLSINGTATIDWGDNSTSTITGTSTTTFKNTTHTYSTGGDYIIKISGTSAVYFSKPILTSNGASVPDVISKITKIELGNIGRTFGPTSSEGPCFKYYNLKSITIPKNITTIGNSCFNYCYNLKFLTLPDTVTTIYNTCFSNCYNLKLVTLPYNLSSIGNGLFGNCYNLKKVIFPYGIYTMTVGTSSSTTIGSGANNIEYIIAPFNISGTTIPYFCLNCSNLKTLVTNITDIGTNFASSCGTATKMIFLGDVTHIANNSFAYNICMEVYDFTHCSSVPTLDGTAFSNIKSNCKIVVPDSLYSTWKTTSNWSTYASNIVSASDYTE